jgi:hypothetical protein
MPSPETGFFCQGVQYLICFDIEELRRAREKERIATTHTRRGDDVKKTASLLFLLCLIFTSYGCVEYEGHRDYREHHEDRDEYRYRDENRDRDNRGDHDRDGYRGRDDENGPDGEHNYNRY